MRDNPPQKQNGTTNYTFEISRAHTSSQARDSGFRHVLASQVLNHVAALFRAAIDTSSVRYHHQYKCRAHHVVFCVSFFELLLQIATEAYW